ncbi:MAG: zinc-ribbon domain-containing protein [Candidatus Hodarchaeales archaeon]|jgi:DNA repair exonuclease SbcCD ATPase subunit
MYCPQCGTKLRETANFCKRCGAPVKGRSISQSNQNVSPDFIQKAKTKILNATSPKIDSLREKTTKRIDNFMESLNDPNRFQKLSNTQREKLAQSLHKIREKVAKDEDTGIVREPTEEEAQEIIAISEELMKRIREDRCPICLKDLNPKDTGETIKVSVCPNCGHGGHQHHIKPWIDKKENCPFCKMNLKAKELISMEIT